MTAKTAHGEHVTSPYVIVKVHTDEGIVGLGEATISGLWSGETQAGTVAAIRDYIAPQLVGKDPRDITAAAGRWTSSSSSTRSRSAAVEMALWDIAGKAAGVPVYQLLGGKVRDKVRIKLVVWARDVPGSRKMAEEHLGSRRHVREGEDRPRPGGRHRPRAGGARSHAGPTSPSPSTPTAAGRSSRRSTASAHWPT